MGGTCGGCGRSDGIVGALGKGRSLHFWILVPEMRGEQVVVIERFKARRALESALDHNPVAVLLDVTCPAESFRPGSQSPARPRAGAVARCPRVSALH